MKRQADLLSFVRKVPRSEPEKPAQIVQNSPTVSVLEDSSIIPDTPYSCIPSSKCAYALDTQASDCLSSKPTVIRPSPAIHLKTSTPRRSSYKHRRSSLTVRRQAEINEKLVQEFTKENLNEASPVLRANKLANTAAKLRRGMYDELNYAPIDQIKSDDPSSCVGNLSAKFTSRTQRLVEHALKPARTDLPILPFNRMGSSSDQDSVLQSLETKTVNLNLPGCLTVNASQLLDKRTATDKYDHKTSQLHPNASGNRDTQTATVHPTSEDLLLEQLNLSNWSEISLGCDETCSASIQQIPLTAEAISQCKFIRGMINDIQHQRSHLILQVDLEYDPTAKFISPPCGYKSVIVELSGSWTETVVHLGDTVHIVPGVGLSVVNGKILLDDTDVNSRQIQCPALLVVHPDTLISGTKLVGSFYCERRGVLEQFWSSGEEEEQGTSLADTTRENAPPEHVMLMGSMLHELFQKLIVSDSPTKDAAHNIVDDILGRPDSVLQMYGCNYPYSTARTNLSNSIGKVLSWIKLNRDPRESTSSGRTDNLMVREVVDIEENIWSTRLGIKGKIDVTAIARLSFEQSGSSPNQLSLIPLELKTGRPTYSNEHKGQVLLYLLMLLDRYGASYTTSTGSLITTATRGWLVYLQRSHLATTPSDLISPNLNSFRALIQTRNRLASQLNQFLQHSLDNPRSVLLPPTITNTRTCQMCPMQLACGLLRSSSDDGGTDGSVMQLLASKQEHLSPAHVEFFTHWSNLLILESSASQRVEDVISRIVTNRPDSGHSSECVLRGLKVINSQCQNIHGSTDWETVFRPSGPSSLGLSSGSSVMTNPGDLVLVSSDDGTHVGCLLGTVVSKGKACLSVAELEPNDIILRTSRSLPTWIRLFRLDRYVSTKILQMNLSNLVGFMQNTPLCAHLRSVIIDGCQPSFTATLSKQVVTRIRGLLKHLNTCQRTAILRVLMANHYLLIKGYPGTGKTETLATLLRVLILLNKKILVVAHTHSAVDNLLARLIQSGEKRILRLGSVDRVHRNLSEYCLEHLLSTRSINDDPLDFLQSIIERAAVVGCTAVSAGGGAARHAALTRSRFDVVLIDEASQLLLPTSLGSLLRLTWSEDVSERGRFVLVGDPHQLPPLVRNPKAREGGLDCSLFTHLLRLGHDQQNAEQSTPLPHVVELNLQYRMNTSVLRLANHLFYQESLKAANETVANGTLADQLVSPLTQNTFNQQLPPWVCRALSPSPQHSTLFLDIVKTNKCTPIHNHARSNELEAQMVSLLARLFITCGVSATDIGVIAPHRNQVTHIRRLLCASCMLPDRRPTVDASTVEVNTVDQYQGRDKRLIILSLTVCSGRNCVGSDLKSNTQSPVGLLDDDARLTVAITRAKHKLIIVGCSGKHPEDPDLRPSNTLAKLVDLMGKSDDLLEITEQDLNFIHSIS